MRNPKRIENVLYHIQQIWEQYPDLRLMQLLQNAVGHQDNYNLEDDKLINKLINTYKVK